MAIWRSVVGKLWGTIILLVAFVLFILGVFLLQYIDLEFPNDAAEVKRLFIITSIIGFLMTTFFAFFLSSKITQPLRQLKRAAHMVTMGKYDLRLEVKSSDEIGQLTAAFNHMGEQLEAMIRDLSYEKEHLSSILRSMTDAVLTFEADGRLILSNPQGEQLLATWRGITGEPEDENISQDGAQSQVPVPLQDVFKAIAAGKKEVTTKLYVGHGVWSVVMAPLYTHGLLRGAVAVLRDFTEQDRLEKLRRDFVANVSHELRTPISMLQGYSEALIDDIASSPEERIELARVIYDESLRMGRLVQDLLDLSSLEAGRLVLQTNKLDISHFIQRVYRKFIVLARERDLTLILDLKSEDLPLVLHEADEDRLEQVLTNLLENAMRHTSAGKMIVIRGFRSWLKGEASIVIEVEDQGEGIAAGDLPYIFDRFFKADKARRRGDATGGTGLGLAIVKYLVEAHGGSIQCRSKIGQGTTFIVTIPVTNRSIGVERSR